MDEQGPVVVLHAFAIRLARMVNPPGAVSSGSSVDDRAVGQLKQESVIWIARIASRLSVGEALDETPAEEAGAAKHADRSHSIPFGMLDKIDPSTAFHDARRSWSKCLIRIVCDPSKSAQERTRISRPQSKPSSFVEIIGSLSGRNSS